jgi:hypothetical protein
MGFAVPVYLHVESHRVAADRAVFDVVLVSAARDVDWHDDLFAAGVADIGSFEMGGWPSSAALWAFLGHGTSQYSLEASLIAHRHHLVGDVGSISRSSQHAGPGGDIVIPDTITGETIVGIGANAFANVHGVTGITIPDTVTSIGSDAFIWCNNLASVTFKANAPAVGSSAFLVTRTPHPVAYRTATLNGYGVDGSTFNGLTVATPGA